MKKKKSIWAIAFIGGIVGALMVQGVKSILTHQKYVSDHRIIIDIHKGDILQVEDGGNTSIALEDKRILAQESSYKTTIQVQCIMARQDTYLFNSDDYRVVAGGVHDFYVCQVHYKIIGNIDDSKDNE